MNRSISLAIILALSPSALAEEPLSGSAIIHRSQRAFFYAGSDMRARVTMQLVTADGKTRTRVLTMLRKNAASGETQKYFIYFHEPGDVRRTSFLVWKYPEKDDDRWIFIPAVNMVRRIAASDSRSSFVGSDFTYEDISGRDVGADEHKLLREERLGDVDCWVVESVPKAPAEFKKKLSWVDKKTFLPRKEEYLDAQGDVARIFTADVVTAVPARSGTLPTITKRTMKNVKSGHRTEVTFADVAYDVGLDDRDFSERSLESPPQGWIR